MKSIEIDSFLGFTKTGALREIAFQLAVANESRVSETEAYQRMTQTYEKFLNPASASVADHQWNAETIKNTPTDTLVELIGAIVVDLTSRGKYMVILPQDDVVYSEITTKVLEKLHKAITHELLQRSTVREWDAPGSPNLTQNEIAVGAAIREAMEQEPEPEPEPELCQDEGCPQQPTKHVCVERPTRLNLFELFRGLKTVYGDLVDTWDITENPTTAKLSVAIPHQQLAGNEITIANFFNDCKLIPKGYTISIAYLQPAAVPVPIEKGFPQGIALELQRVWGGSGFDHLDSNREKRILTVWVNKNFQVHNMYPIKNFTDNLKPFGWLVEVIVL